MTLLSLLFSSSSLAADISFGSFGRVTASTEASGGAGAPADVVAYPSRLQKAPYVEVDLRFDQDIEGGSAVKVVITPAITGDLFHYTGEWDADIALRNLFADFSLGSTPLSLWAGSRIVRGDDVYLLDFWPLDSLNLVGGGVRFRPERWDFSGSVGLSRIGRDFYQLQTAALPSPVGVGTEEVLFLDRQRLVSALKGSRTVGPESLQVRLSGYGELHTLPAGERLQDDLFVQQLPPDVGTLVGAQLSAWGWAEESFAHLWLRRSTGLAAYGTLGVPSGLATDYRAAGAEEILLATAANHAIGPATLQAGAYLRRFTDADANDIDPDDRWEANVALRPTVFPHPLFSLGAELSQQWLHPDGLNPRTGAYDIPLITKLAILPAIQPMARSFSRPQVRLQYIYTHLNDAARSWFASADPRHDTNHLHFIGVGAEWWLNSESYR